MMRSNDSTWLMWLSRARFLAITALFGVELAIVSYSPNRVSLGLLSVTVCVWYTVAALLLLLRNLSEEVHLQARLQVLTDLVFATVIVYVTGGIDSPFTFLYPLVILVSAILLPRLWTYFIAALSFLCFGAVVELSYFGLIPSFSYNAPEPATVRATVLVNLAAFLAIAYLASYLTVRLRAVREQLVQHETALADLRALHETIVQSISSGLIATDEQRRVTFVNHAAEDLLGCSHDQWAGRSVADLLSPTLAARDAGRTEHRVTVAGAEKIFGVSVSPLHVSGTVGTVYAIEDLTEVRRLEREVRVQDRMAAVGRMAAGIAHEIRNPLTSIAGSVIMLRDEVQLNEEQRVLMDIVIRESERLNDIVGDFLAYTRDKDFRFEPVDLVRVLADTVALLENRQEVAAGAIRVRSDFAVPRAVTVADPDRLKQVLWNLSENAMRAMREGELTVGLEEAGEMWAITVADTGRGMSAETQERIFEPFQSEFTGGTGLGLAIVYQIVQAHEGVIRVDSAPGRGSKFRLELKRANAAAAAAGQGYRG